MTRDQWFDIAVLMLFGLIGGTILAAADPVTGVVAVIGILMVATMLPFSKVKRWLRNL